MINFFRTVPGDQGFENISSCPLGLEGIVLLVLIVQTRKRGILILTPIIRKKSGTETRALFLPSVKGIV